MWVKIWSSDSIKATARGTAALMGKYWMCVQVWSSQFQSLYSVTCLFQLQVFSAPLIRASSLYYFFCYCFALMGKYWMCVPLSMCVQENQTTSTFLFGKNDDLVLKQKIVMPKGLGEVFDPRYFAFSCDGDEGYFSNIEVDPINVYEAYLEVEAKGVAAVGEVSGKLCSILNCQATTTEGDDGTMCVCCIINLHVPLMPQHACAQYA